MVVTLSLATLLAAQESSTGKYKNTDLGVAFAGVFREERPV